MAIEKIGVLGAGQMGHGIAQVAAVSGFDVVLYDIDGAALERARANVTRSLDKLVSKERINSDLRDAALSRLSESTDFAEVCNVDLAIEAVSERESLKFDIFKQLDETCPEHTILASNTSSI